MEVKGLLLAWRRVKAAAAVTDDPLKATDLVLEQHRLAELTILYEVSRALQRTLSQRKALQTILVGVSAGPGLAFNRAFVLLVDEKEKALLGRLAVGPESPEAASIIFIGRNHGKYVLSSV